MLRRNDERRYRTQIKNKIWQTFYATGESLPARAGFADLLCLDEVRIPPAGALSRSDAEGDAFTYVHRGAIAQGKGKGSLVVQAGDFQRMAVGDARDESNGSSTDWAHIFRLRIACDPLQRGEASAATQQERFTAAQRRNTLCLVASPNGALGSLKLRSDALIYSSLLDVGHHFVHALRPGRNAWLHMVCGSATLDSTFELTQGDGIGICGVPALSVTAHEDSEILLVDMGPASSS